MKITVPEAIILGFALNDYMDKNHIPRSSEEYSNIGREITKLKTRLESFVNQEEDLREQALNLGITNWEKRNRFQALRAVGPMETKR